MSALHGFVIVALFVALVVELAGVVRSRWSR